MYRVAVGAVVILTIATFGREINDAYGTQTATGWMFVVPIANIV